ncbi:hypothetical protein GCM10023194_53180 [Planotetraspora phitsanulokensis]|uniref:Uncharacterized protein n=1 Tax=Planotetraspora phitsanulokensis TaxID=575192 RepID=A0A8J3UDS5_9ACTN|nr:hypothetical protein [Planotetraspora phitsanulokensis]GII42656.1 hypothetical protein Pph01_76590 [Planotetraspora phitsanulokensis]
MHGAQRSTAVRHLILIAAALVALLAVSGAGVTVALPAFASSSAPSTAALHGSAPSTGLPGSAPGSVSSAGSPAGRVVLIGVPGLRWDDLDPARTPNLWALAGKGGVASLSTRTVPPEGMPVTCPAGGWLTVSAGQRAGTGGNSCTPAPTPVVAPDGSATVPGWAALVALQRAGSYKADIGLLGQTIIGAGGRIAAIGPGAGLAAADKSGKIQKYAATPDELPDLTPYTVVFAEAGEIAQVWNQEGDARRSAVAAADRTVGSVLTRVPAGATVLVAGLSDSGATAHLHVAMATGPARSASPGSGPLPYEPGLLTASSTRQDALVTLTDLTATVTHVLGITTPEGTVGRPWQPDGPSDGTAKDSVARLADADLASQVLKQVREPFFLVLVVAQLLFYALAAVVMRRYRRMFVPAQIVAVVSAAVPVSTFLAQLVPWWSLAHPMAALCGTILVVAGAIAAVAFAGPWRGHVLGPLTVVAGVSSLALLIDVMTGSRLQVNAVTGYEPVTGGRFYGFGNMAFAVYSTGTILLLAGVSQALRRWRGWALVLCLAYGLLAIVADGWPGWGADFGGVPSFILGFAVFLLLITGRRVSVVRLAVIGAGGVVAVGLIAVADWLRPADQRTHLGTFVQQVVDGEGGSVVGRKLGAMLHTLGNLPLTLLSLVALAFLFLVLYRPSTWGAPALSQAYGHAPALRAGLLGALTAALAGFLVNDSGVAIPAMALTVAVPLTLAASVRALQLSTPTTPDRSSAPADTMARPANGPR